jgi:hypothetical protein
MFGLDDGLEDIEIGRKEIELEDSFTFTES